MSQGTFLERIEALRSSLAEAERGEDNAEPVRGFGNFHDFQQWNDWRNWNNPPQPGHP